MTVIKQKYYSKDANGNAVALGDLVASSWAYGSGRVSVIGTIRKITTTGLMEIDIEEEHGKHRTPMVQKFHPKHTTLLAPEAGIDKYRASLVEFKKKQTSKEGK